MPLLDAKHERASVAGKRILQAVAECDRFIAKEGPRAAGLRPASIQKTLDHYVTHRARLIGALAD